MSKASTLKEEKARKRRAKQEARRARRQANGLRAREVDQRPLRFRMLIVCEGEKTEPNYLKDFPVNAQVVELRIEGDGRNTLSLVDQAIALRDSDGPFDEVWTVFDRDSFPLATFNAALQRARSADITVAWSNEAFEIWYLLHFEYCDAALDRTTYGTRLACHLGRPYAKNSRQMYATLEGRQNQAIMNAKRLIAAHPQPIDAGSANPATTVYRLVERLCELSK